MGRLERLYDRYRRKGDAEALGEVFDLSGAELMRVAAHLAGDVAEAEDLVQETFLVAIEGAAGWDRSRRLMPWLCGILANQARLARRRAQRRVDPTCEAPSMRAEVVDADAPRVAVEAELSGRVEEALRGLPERYREVLVPHLVDGARPVEIARALDRAPGTVRMQIQRGLVLLRRSLPPGALLGVLAETGRGAAALRAALGARAAPPPAAPRPPAAAAQTPWILGGALVSTKLFVLAAAALGVAALVWLANVPDAPAIEAARLDGGERAPVSDASTSASLAGPGAAAVAEREVPRPASEPSLDATRAPAAAPIAPDTGAAAGGWFLEGHVLGAEEPYPAREVSVNVFCFALEEHRMIACGVEEDGSFSVDLTSMFLEPGPPVRELLISANHERYASGNEMLTVGADVVGRDPSERTVLRRDVRVRPACGMRGRLALDGERLRAARLAVFHVGADGAPADGPFRTAEFEGESDDDGAFEFRSARPGEYVLAATAPGLKPLTLRVSVPPATLVELGDLRLESGGAALRGTVRLPDGTPAGAGRRALVEAVCETVDEYFEYDGIDGVAEAGLPPELERELWNGLAWREGPEGAGFAPVRRGVRTDADGGFAIEGLSERGYRLAVTDVEGFVGLLTDPGPVVEAPAAGITLEAGTCRIDVEVVDAAGVPLVAGLELLQDGGGLSGPSTGDGRGSFLAELGRDYVLGATQGGYARAERDAPADGRGVRTSYTLVLEPRTDVAATLELALPPGLDPDLPRAKVTLTRHAGEDDEVGNVTRSETLAADGGVFRVEDLAPGRWSVELEPNENSFGLYYESWWLPARLDVELAAGETRRAELALERGGRVRVHVEEPAGTEAPPGDVSAELVDARGAARDVRFVTRIYEGNVLRLGGSTGAAFVGQANDVYPNLEPGTYTLRLEREGFRFPPVTFTIRAGETVEVRAPGRAE